MVSASLSDSKAMKRIFLFIAVFCSLAASAQDRIFFRDGRVTEAKVLTVFPETVEYVRFDNQSGPRYNISKDRLVQIVYENGVKDVFSEQQARVSPDVDGSGQGSRLYEAEDKADVRKPVSGSDYKWKRSRFSVNLMPGLAMLDSKSLFLNEVTGSSPEYYEVFKEIYHNSPGLSIGAELSYDFYLKKNRPWYVGCGLGVYYDMAYGRIKYESVDLMKMKTASGTAMALLWFGQQFPPKDFGANFYWKAGLGAGISFAQKAGYEVTWSGYEGEDRSFELKGESVGFQMRGILEAGIGGQHFRLGLRYAPGFTPFINIKDSEAKLKSLHTISLVLSLMW